MSGSDRGSHWFKSVRDPLYGFVGLTGDETGLMRTGACMRMHEIKQLSHTHLVYPSAVHTRYEHSIGVVHLADRISRHLGFNDEQRGDIRAAGLLHDVGHGPFSHLFEAALERVNGRKIDHDRISMMLIREDPEISSILGEARGERLVQMLSHEPISGWEEGMSSLASDVVSGPLDADKMDYLRRDAYHVGVAYGQFDLHRMIHTLTSTEGHRQKRICIMSKGRDAVESYRLARYLMHAQVYKHHTRLVADHMFLSGLDLAVDEGVIPREMLEVNDDLDAGHADFLTYYKGLNDHTIYDLIIRESTGAAGRILRAVRERRLLKRVIELVPEIEIVDAETRTGIMKKNPSDLARMSGEIASDLGLESHEVMALSLEIPVSLYDGEILIMHKGVPRKLDEFSPINTESKVSKFYVFGPDDESVRDRIKRRVNDHLEIGP